MSTHTYTRTCKARCKGLDHSHLASGNWRISHPFVPSWLNLPRFHGWIYEYYSWGSSIAYGTCYMSWQLFLFTVTVSTSLGSGWRNTFTELEQWRDGKEKRKLAKQPALEFLSLVAQVPWKHRNNNKKQSIKGEMKQSQTESNQTKPNSSAI